MVFTFANWRWGKPSLKQAFFQAGLYVGRALLQAAPPSYYLLDLTYDVAASQGIEKEGGEHIRWTRINEASIQLRKFSTFALQVKVFKGTIPTR